MAQRIFSVRNGRGDVVCATCTVADSFLTRLRGLLGRKELPADDGLLLTRSWSVHTWFMHFPIDLVYLESDLTVLGIREGVKPWRMSGWRGARSVLELPAGACERLGLRPGDRLELAAYEEERASVLLVLEQHGEGSVVVGRGPLSAAARTIDAISELDVDVSAVVVRDEADSAR